MDYDENVEFSESPEQMETTCGIRAKTKKLAQIFGLFDLNDNRLLCLMLFIIFHSSDYY